MKEAKKFILAGLTFFIVAPPLSAFASPISNLEQAKAIAIKEFGLTEQSVQLTEFEQKKGGYQLELVANQIEYDIRIEAQTGRITKQTHKTLSAKKQAYLPQVQLSLEVALERALAEAKLTTQSIDKVQIDLEQERGRLVYSADVRSLDRTVHTEYTIDAQTGEIVAVEIDD